VRKALSLAIDRDQLLKTTNDGRGNIIGPLPPGIGMWALPESELRASPVYKPDLNMAKSLLAEAGVPNGFKIEGLISATNGAGPNVDDAQFIKDAWSKIGVETTLRLIEGSTNWYNEMAKGAFNWTVFSHSGFYDPDDYFVTYYRTGAVRNYGSIDDPKANDLIDKQRTIVNDADRKKVTDDLQRYLIDQIYFTYLYAREFPVGVQNYVKNYLQNSIPYASHRHWDVLWLDK
jgi:peptide/nickel transport system substrate-binding protein